MKGDSLFTKSALEKGLENLRCNQLCSDCKDLNSLSVEEVYIVVINIENFIRANLGENPEDQGIETSIKQTQFVKSRLRNPLLYFEVDKVQYGFAYYTLKLSGVYDRGKSWGHIKDFSFSSIDQNVSTQIGLNSYTYKKQWWVLSKSWYE